MSGLPVGKLRAEMLQAFLDKAPVRDPRVLVGPRVGEDAAVIALGERCLVATTDPITFATDEAAWYAVQVNVNDLAVRGARPRWFRSEERRVGKECRCGWWRSRCWSKRET